MSVRRFWMSWREGREYFPSRNDVERRVPERRPNHPHYSLFMLLPSGLSLDVVSSLTVHFVWDVHTIPFFSFPLSLCVVLLIPFLSSFFAPYYTLTTPPTLFYFLFFGLTTTSTHGQIETRAATPMSSPFFFFLWYFFIFFQAPPLFFFVHVIRPNVEVVKLKDNNGNKIFKFNTKKKNKKEKKNPMFNVVDVWVAIDVKYGLKMEQVCWRLGSASLSDMCVYISNQVTRPGRLLRSWRWLIDDCIKRKREGCAKGQKGGSVATPPSL